MAKTGNNSEKNLRKDQERASEQARAYRLIRNISIVVLLLAVLLVAIPRLTSRLDRTAVRADNPVITLPPQGADTFVFEATAAPTVAAASMQGGSVTTADNASRGDGAAPGEGGRTPIPTVAPTPTATPLPTPTPEPTAVPTAAPQLNAGNFRYLPVVNDVDTDKKWIAITVDDCFQVGNLQKILACAYKNKALLTIFPIGQNLTLSGMKQTLQKAVKLGYEIENHTWSHARVFRLPESEMAAEIWKQDEMLNRVLGVSYQEHFFRCMGGDGELDQRTHNYLRQLGYKGIAHWSLSGSDATPEQIRKHLHPGAVYLFHTTDRDTKVLLQFIPWVAKKGYKMVTLNKLVGLGSNAVSKYKSRNMPQPQPYAYDYRTIRRGEYSWVTVLLQNKLRQLGILKMTGQSTGYYGDQTRKAVAVFQQARGLPVTGDADAMTQAAIMAE